MNYKAIFNMISKFSRFSVGLLIGQISADEFSDWKAALGEAQLFKYFQSDNSADCVQDYPVRPKKDRRRKLGSSSSPSA